MEKGPGEKSMERTFALLDTVDFKAVVGKGEVEAHKLMDILEYMLQEEVDKYPELEGFLFDNVSECEFVEYLEKRYGRCSREVTINYISID